MTDPIRESESLPAEPAANGSSTTDDHNLDAPAADSPPAENPVVERIRRRVRTQTASEQDRMRTMEDRLMRLEELLTAQAQAKATVPPTEVAEIAPPADEDTPVAEIAPPVAPLISDAPVATVLDAPLASVAPTATPAGPQVRRGWQSWFVIQSLRLGFNNFRLFLRMYVDPRYRMTWLGRLVPLAFFLYLILPDWEIFSFLFFWRAVPMFGNLFDMTVLLTFGWVTVKVLGWEMRRYQDVVPDVPDVLRWGSR